MNKSLRQLFTIVVALFVILGMSTTIITAIRANQLNNDPRNTRALYHEYGAPRDESMEWLLAYTAPR